MTAGNFLLFIEILIKYLKYYLNIFHRKEVNYNSFLFQTNLMEKLKEEEEERLCLAGLPLRHYLMKYVFPTLTQGLVEVANLRPDDPVDFLVSRNSPFV